MEGNSEDKDGGHDDRNDVEGDHGDWPPVPALEHLNVTQLYQKDVDHAHRTKE